jgi:hypothetical protein
MINLREKPKLNVFGSMRVNSESVSNESDLQSEKHEGQRT